MTFLLTRQLRTLQKAWILLLHFFEKPQRSFKQVEVAPRVMSAPVGQLAVDEYGHLETHLAERLLPFDV